MGFFVIKSEQLKNSECDIPEFVSYIEGFTDLLLNWLNDWTFNIYTMQLTILQYTSHSTKTPSYTLNGDRGTMQN